MRKFTGKLRLPMPPTPLALSWVLFFVALTGAPASLAPAQESAPPPQENTVEPLPEMSPAWLDGYQVRYPLRVVGAVANSTSQSVVARLSTGNWLRADGADVAVQAADGTLLPVCIRSHATTGETLIQFPRHGVDPWYWAYAVHPSAPPAAAEPLPEGITLEVRDWKGTRLDSWSAVREGLTQSDPVIACALVAEVLQNSNPARPGLPRNYAVTYRGYLNIKQPGVHRFFVNSEDASFLFIDGFMVCDRPGANPRVVGNIPVRSVGVDLELTAGVHPFEVYQALGENPSTYGGCMLLWVPPEAKLWTVVPRDTFAHPDVAYVAAVEARPGTFAAVLDYGIDDTLVAAGGATLHLVRFEAQGTLPADSALQWDFGDGTKATGRSPRHVYFAPGDYTVTLSCGGSLPAYQRRVHVWAAPGAISPFSVGAVIDALQSLQEQWSGIPIEQQDQALDFLFTCDHPNRWPLIATMVRQRLKAPGLDPQFRAQMYRWLIESLANTGQPADVNQAAEAALKEFAKLPSLQVGVELAAALAYQRQFSDSDEAASRYEAILDKHRRLEHPDLRLAAIRWGDLLVEAGDREQAGELYRTAAALGGDDFSASSQSAAVTRGALLRVAEQKLRTGNIIETRQLLDKIELNYPEQKLEGLYRFLRAEADRHAGRYEEALRNYEVLLQLRQWSGYRDRTLHGIADCYARMDDVPQALRWFGQLEKNHHGYFEAQKLADQQKLLVSRQERITAAGDPAGRAPAFQDFVTGFEPDEPAWFGKPENFKIIRGLGLAGPHVGLFESHPVYLGYLTYNRPLPNLTPGGHYWVECWYREDLFSMAPGFNPHMYFYVYGEGTQLHPTRGQGTYFMERSVGAWRKAGLILDAPLANDGRVTLSVLTVGAIQIDGLSVRAVTDRDLDALSNFIERTGEGESP
jgi:tetratricopeptide (TPR) repeat protein